MPIIKEEMQRQVQAIGTVFAERMAGAALIALEQMVGMAQMDLDTSQLSPSQKQAILEAIMDRHKETAKIEGGGNVGQQLNLNFSKMSDNELMQTALELLGVPIQGQLPVVSANGQSSD